jgi:hypothetical protein
MISRLEGDIVPRTLVLDNIVGTPSKLSARLAQGYHWTLTENDGFTLILLKEGVLKI